MGLQIAIDASRITVSQRTGTENYALQLIRQLILINNDHHLHLYFRNEPQADLLPQHQNWTPHVIPWPRAWTHLRFASELWRTRPDVTFVPAHTLPRFFPGKAVVTVHDLGYIYFPDAHPENERQYLDWSTRYSANRATQVLADSEATRQDLIKAYGINAAKIHVVYPAPDETLAPVTDTDRITSVKAKYGITQDYLFFLGTLQPRKNIGRMIEAFQQFRHAHPDTKIQLVLGGKRGWLFDETWLENAEGVHLTGYIDDDDVAALYSGATAFLFPSLYEGFGFPALEAMRCSTPVLCSNTSSLPELGGDAAIYVDPTSVDSIAAGIAEIVNQSAEARNAQIQRGFTQLEKFTWQQAAVQTLHVLEVAATS